MVCCMITCVFFKQKTAYEMRSSVWSSDVCSSDLDDYKAWLAWALDEMDGCDILVPISSEGGGMGSEKYWHNAFEVDVMGPVSAVEAVIPGLTEKASGSFVLFAHTSAAAATRGPAAPNAITASPVPWGQRHALFPCQAAHPVQ